MEVRFHDILQFACTKAFSVSPITVKYFNILTQSELCRQASHFARGYTERLPDKHAHACSLSHTHMHTNAYIHTCTHTHARAHTRTRNSESARSPSGVLLGNLSHVEGHAHETAHEWGLGPGVLGCRQFSGLEVLVPLCC